MDAVSRYQYAAVVAAVVCGAVLCGGARADTYYIEIDWMGASNVPVAHDHQPSQLVLDAVVQMFACEGHTLVIDLSNEVTHYIDIQGNPEVDGGCGEFWTYDDDPDTFAAIKAANFDHADDPEPWHYCLFAHQYKSLNSDDDCVTSGSSGRSDGGENLIVTLGNFDGGTGTEFVQASTLAHEFGHCLGLSHCGTLNCNGDPEDSDFVGNFVPNMPSVMTYSYQLVGVRNSMISLGLTFDEALFKEIDYSHGRMCTLNEDDLNETLGTIMVPTDWDCDGNLNVSVAQDINNASSGWCGATGNRTVVDDYNEWANIDAGALLARRRTPADLAELERRRQVLDAEPCISSQEWDQLKLDLGLRGGGPALAVEPCLDGQNVYLGNAFIFQFGTCDFPFENVQSAHDVFPEESVFYFQAGTYNAGAGVLLTKPGKYFCKTGSAVIQ